jgi:hypothetical protein
MCRVSNDASSTIGHWQADLFHQLQVIIHAIDIEALIREHIQIVLDRAGCHHCLIPISSSFSNQEERTCHEKQETGEDRLFFE